MKLMVVSFITGLFMLVSFVGCSKTVTRETVTTMEDRHTQTVTTTKINDEVIQTLKTEWQDEYLEAIGMAYVGSRYPDVKRNKALALKGAKLDAERNIVEQIYKVHIDARTTMRDMDTYDYVTSEVKGSLIGVEMLTETFNEAENRWEVSIRVPKTTLIRILEQYKVH
ncbi:MAG: hypothetical protein DRP47_03755 [Candidatus Zixiibacteriota bacterium]|nr:MAG: hypothetical protein DRP47_03755 [candidate division Zixibacteria bacterium]